MRLFYFIKSWYVNWNLHFFAQNKEKNCTLEEVLLVYSRWQIILLIVRSIALKVKPLKSVTCIDKQWIFQTYLTWFRHLTDWYVAMSLLTNGIGALQYNLNWSKCILLSCKIYWIRANIILHEGHHLLKAYTKNIIFNNGFSCRNWVELVEIDLFVS